MQECSHLGISGQDLKAELQQLPQQLPELLLKAVQRHIQAYAVSEASQYYCDFAAYTQAHREAGSSTSSSKDMPLQLLPNLAKVISATRYELLSYADAVNAVTQPVPIVLESLAEAAPESSTTSAEIEWNTNAEPQQQGSPDGGVADIDWDVDMSLEAEAGDNVVPASSDATIDIDWDIDIADEGTDMSEQTASQQHQRQESAQATSGPKVQGLIAHIVDNAEDRNALQNDLHELLVRGVAAVVIRQRELHVMWGSYRQPCLCHP